MTDETTYGRRFLDAWKRYSGALGSFSYAEIQSMKAADREQFVQLLRARSSSLPYATIQLLRESEPEEAARVLHVQAVQASQATLYALLMLS